MAHHELILVGRVLLAFAISFVIGFERELRGLPLAIWLLGLLLGMILLVDLELRNIPLLARLDARRSQHMARDDLAPPATRPPPDEPA